MADSDTLPPPFLTRIDAKPKRPPPSDDEQEEAIAPGNAFAVARGLRAPATLKFLYPDGSLMFAFAYGHLPHVWGGVPGAIVLEYPHIGSVLLAVKQGQLLESRLCEYRVTWIRQSTAAEAASLTTAVTCIRRIKRYPSHEPDAEDGSNLFAAAP